MDIRLESPLVRTYVRKHLELLADIGAWAVRLDAVAYYKKSIGGKIRHNTGVNALADNIARMAQQCGLQVFAQLNRDKEGLKYFVHSDFKDVAVNDFTFSLFLLLSLVQQNPGYLLEYENSLTDNKIAVRAPRTHDGILLRSKSISELERATLIEKFQQHGIQMRIEGGTPYEFNCSLPFLLDRCFSGYSSPALELVIAITCMSSGIAYLYLPMLVGFSPENEPCSIELDDDPRAMNRRPISTSHMKQAKDSGWLTRVHQLLRTFGEIRREITQDSGLRFANRRADRHELGNH